MYRPHIVCVYVPDFRLHLAYQEWGGEPMNGLALVDPEQGRRRIIAASPGARLDGVVRGMLTTAATALAPDLWIRNVDRIAELQAHLNLEKSLRRCCPKIESTGAGVIYTDFRGLERRYTESGEGGFLDDLRETVMNAGFPVRLGIAGNRFVARAAAIFQGKLPGRGPSPLQIPLGEEALFLSPLPLELLPDAKQEIEALNALGIRSLGAFANLPEDGVVRRFGRKGIRLLRLARGEDRAQLLPKAAPKAYRKSTQIAPPLHRREHLEKVLWSLLADLIRDLDKKSLATRSFRWTLALEGRNPLHRELPAASPSADQSLWKDLLQLQLEHWQVPAPVTGAEVEAISPVLRPVSQRSFAGPKEAEPGAMSRSLAHLSQELKQGSLGTHRPQENRWPEQRVKLVPASLHSMAEPKKTEKAELWISDRCPIGQWPQAVRWEDPPIPIEVLAGKDTLPRRLHWQNKWQSILRSQGPWDLSDGSWASTKSRRYFQLEGSFGAAQVFQERITQQWFLWAWVD